MINKEIDLRNKEGVYHEEKKIRSSTLHNVIQWAVEAKEDKELNEERRNSISGFHKSFIKFQELNPSLEGIFLDEITDDIVKLYITFLDTVADLAGKTINKYIWALEKVAEYAKSKAASNTILSFKHLRVKQVRNETERFPPLSFAEKERAFDYFRQKNPYVYLFILHVYYTCIRPVELHRLKVKHINLKAKTIFIPWYDAKNGLSNYVQILEPLFEALLDFNIDSLDPEMYLFGDLCEPSFNQHEGHYTSEVWFRQREKMKMPKEKQLYGLKHTFNVDYVENNKKNIDWEWLRRHNRHATTQQTQQYISGLTAYFLDESKAKIINHHKKSKPKDMPTE